MTEPGLPTSSLNRSTLSMTRQRPPSVIGASPIAADGGFGPMNNEDSEDDEIEEGSGDDFDDFEAGAVDEDFGDFGEGFQESLSPQMHKSEPTSSDQAHVSSISPFVSRSVAGTYAHILGQFLVALARKHS